VDVGAPAPAGPAAPAEDAGAVPSGEAKDD